MRGTDERLGLALPSSNLRDVSAVRASAFDLSPQSCASIAHGTQHVRIVAIASRRDIDVHVSRSIAMVRAYPSGVKARRATDETGLRFLLARWAPSCSLRIMRTAETKRKRANRSPPLENRYRSGKRLCRLLATQGTAEAMPDGHMLKDRERARRARVPGALKIKASYKRRGSASLFPASARAD